MELKIVSEKEIDTLLELEFKDTDFITDAGIVEAGKGIHVSFIIKPDASQELRTLLCHMKVNGRWSYLPGMSMFMGHYEDYHEVILSDNVSKRLIKKVLGKHGIRCNITEMRRVPGKSEYVVREGWLVNEN